MWVRALYLILILEIGGGGYLLTHRALRPQAQLPPLDQLDQTLAGDLARLAEQAEERGTPEAWSELAKALHYHGFYSEAEQAFRYVLRHQPDNREARGRLAYCLERTGRTGESTAVYRPLTSGQVKSRGEADTRMYELYEMGRNLLREENAREAEAVFRQNRGYLPARYQLAKLMVNSGRSAEALELIDASLQQIPNSLKFLDLKYRALRQLGRDRDAAETAFWKELSTHRVPLNPSADAMLSIPTEYGLDRKMEEFNTVLEGGDLDGMVAKLTELLTLVDDAPSTHRPLILERLIEVERRRGNPQQMRSAIDEMHKAGNFNWHILLYEAEADLLSGDLDGAIALARRAASMSSEPHVHNRLADMLQQAGDAAGHDRARALAVRLEAELAFRAGGDEQLQHARQIIENSLDLNPDDALTWFYRGEIRRALEGLNAAIPDYRRCLERDPNCDRAARRITEAAAADGEATMP